MSNYNRAAQFAPFAALVGYEEAIEKSKIMLEKRIDISEDKKREIEAILRKISARCTEFNEIEIKYFILKDKNLNLGSYIKYKGKIKKIDEFEGKIFFLNRKSIYIKDIYDIRINEDE